MVKELQLNIQNTYFNLIRNYQNPYEGYIVFEDLYPHEYFSDLIECIIYSLHHTPIDALNLTGDQILDKVSIDWNGRRFFNLNKKLTVIELAQDQKLNLNLTEEQRDEIVERLKKVYGF